MEHKVLDKKDLTAFLSGLSRSHRLVAPVKRSKVVEFETVKSAEDVYLDAWNTKVPPKRLFFPSTEVLFHFSGSVDGITVTREPLPEESTVIFGVRPCDAKSFTLLDKVFKGEEYRDPYYAARREKTIMMGLVCKYPRATCFCTSVGGSPSGTEGMDVLLTDLGDRYYVQPVTEKGAKLIEGNPFVKPASEEDAEKKQSSWKNSERSMSSKIRLAVAQKKLEGMFDDPFWDAVSEKCLGCAVCTYLCPTCHCFDIVDEATDRRGRRVRNWDSCMFPIFTLQASGHNPRRSGKERMRQRLMHKLNYFVANYGVPACVGCGRCIMECPVNLDVREVIESIASR